MKIVRASFLVLISSCFLIPVAGPAGTVLHLKGGHWRNAGTLAVDELTVDSGATISGIGTVTGTGDVSGVLAPGFGSAVGVLTFQTSVTFRAGSALECHVTGDATADQLVAGGPVTGECQVQVARTGGIPVDQVIVDGNENSSYLDFTADVVHSTNWGLSTRPVGDLLLTDLRGDSDDNGLPDWFELKYWGSRTGTDPAADDDHDGERNRDELVAGTNPKDAGSVLKLSISMLPLNRALVQWPSPSNFWFNVADKMYTLERATNMTVGFDDTLAADIPGNPPENSYTNQLSGEVKAFYQVKVQQ